MVEEVDSTGYKCFEERNEKLYRIWLRMDEMKKCMMIFLTERQSLWKENRN